MIVYIDVLMFINGIITYFLLLVVCSVFSFRPKTYRMILGAILGAIQSLIIFLPDLSVILQILIRIVFCGSITLVTFSFKNILRFLKISGAFLVVTYIFAGAMLAIFEIIKPNILLVANGVTYFDISPLVIIILTTLIYLFLKLLLLFKNNTKEEQSIYECIIKHSGIEVKFLGFCDTGNSLKDPYNNFPVAFVEKKVLLPILELNVKSYPIPVDVINHSGLAFAFKPDGFFVVIENKRKKINCISVAISDNSFGTQFNGILSPLIINSTEE